MLYEILKIKIQPNHLNSDIHYNSDFLDKFRADFNFKIHIFM